MDHGSHPDFKTEWWYVTGNVRDASGRPFGYELALFRQGLQFAPAQKESKWAIRDFYFGNLAISDIQANQFLCFERLSRGALGDAHAGEGKMDTDVHGWSFSTVTPGESAGAAPFEKPGAVYLVNSSEGDAGLHLTLKAQMPLVLEGVAGYSQKVAGLPEASYYYSYPRLATSGTITVSGQSYAVEGTSWFDHEFSTSVLGPNQVGWDWFSIQLDSKNALMIYLMRNKDGKADGASQGTWVRADGTSEQLLPGQFEVRRTGEEWKSPKTGAVYPAGWEIHLAKQNVTLQVKPAMADQELFFGKKSKSTVYWEGACQVEGKLGDRAVHGCGYTELTGYTAPLTLH
jgi:predicted secreted hydrolase